MGDFSLAQGASREAPICIPRPENILDPHKKADSHIIDQFFIPDSLSIL
jgi:hypothetical protein